MKKTIFFLLFVFVNVFNLRGQSFTGIVLDRESHEPVIAANVYVRELNMGTTTDEGGRFVLNQLPQGVLHLEISYIGYETLEEALNLSEIRQKTFYLDEGHIDLKEVVVSVPGGKLQGENVTNVERSSIAQLQRLAPVTLAEALSGISGVAQRSTGAAIGKPVIRGLSGSRIVTYSQGIRIENQQWGDEHGLGIGETGIKSVEVIKGPASLLYGADALGGVLYFVPEGYAKPDEITAFAKTALTSNTLGINASAGLKLNKGPVKFNIFGALSSNADYQIPNKQRVANTRFAEKNIKTALGLHHNNWLGNIYYSYLLDRFGLTDTALYITEVKRTPELPLQNIANHRLSFENLWLFNKSKLNFTAGYTSNNRKEFEDDASSPALGLLLQSFTYHFKWNAPHLINHLGLIAGSQGMLQTNLNSGEEILIPNAQTHDAGGFLIFNYDHSGLHLQTGMRVDFRHILAKNTYTSSDTIPALHRHFLSFNYSVGGTQKTGHFIFRTNLSTGFRAPNTSELLSDGIHEGTNRYEIGNAALKSEHATQMDLSIEYHSQHLNVAVNPFFNSIKNYIFLKPTGQVKDNAPVYEYGQETALLYGGEAGIHYHPHSLHWLHLESNLSWVAGIDRTHNPLPLIPANRLMTTVKVEFKSKRLFSPEDVFVRSVYNFKKSDVSQFETPSDAYHLIDMGTDFKLGFDRLPVNISAGVKNLLNVRYIDHLSRFKPAGIPNMGINFYLSVKAQIHGRI